MLSEPNPQVVKKSLYQNYQPIRGFFVTRPPAKIEATPFEAPSVKNQPLPNLYLLTTRKFLNPGMERRRSGHGYPYFRISWRVKRKQTVDPELPATASLLRKGSSSTRERILKVKITARGVADQFDFNFQTMMSRLRRVRWSTYLLENYRGFEFIGRLLSFFRCPWRFQCTAYVHLDV